MGPNSFRNLTYLAVLAVVGALVYLIYQSSKKKRERLSNPSIETNASLGGIPDSLGSIAASSTATLPTSGAMAGDTVHSAVDGTLLSSPAGATGGAATSLASTSDVRDVTVNDQGSPAAGSGSHASAKGAVSSSSKLKSPATASKGVSTGSGAAAGHAVAKFNAGDGKGEFMVVSGTFSSKDNADAQVAKLKKLGFAGAEAVKLENSASTYVIAGYYAFKGGADAAVRTLKTNKIESYAKKRTGEVYKPSSTPAKPAVKPVAKPVTVAKPS